MALFIPPRRRRQDARQSREYEQYLVGAVGPFVPVMMLVATFGYVLVCLVDRSTLELSLRLIPAAPLLFLGLLARFVRRPVQLGVLLLLCLLMLQWAIILNATSVKDGLDWATPAWLILPLGSTAFWPTRWSFLIAMTICATAPLMFLHAVAAPDVSLLRYTAYMAIAVVMSMVLRAFITRTLFTMFQLKQELTIKAHTDNLTGLLLRNRFFELATLDLEDIHKQQVSACMLYLDADHFKQLNDVHGHAAGDRALASLADCLRQNMREQDLIGRMGGEEFAMFLPGIGLLQARHRAEQLRQSIRALASIDGPMTVSIGIAECEPSGETIESLLARADKAMLQAKQLGRDRVVVSARPE